jgi:hypothetical protein
MKGDMRHFFEECEHDWTEVGDTDRCTFCGAFKPEPEDPMDYDYSGEDDHRERYSKDIEDANKERKMDSFLDIEIPECVDNAMEGNFGESDPVPNWAAAGAVHNPMELLQELCIRGTLLQAKVYRRALIALWMKNHEHGWLLEQRADKIGAYVKGLKKAMNLIVPF